MGSNPTFGSIHSIGHMDFLRILARGRTVATAAAVAVVTLCGCDVAGQMPADRFRSMTDEQVSAYLASNPESGEAQYVTFMLEDGGLNPPTGVTARSLLIFAHEECADRSPPPPPEWRRERIGEPVGFENFVHTGRGFAHRLICPSE